MVRKSIYLILGFLLVFCLVSGALAVNPVNNVSSITEKKEEVTVPGVCNQPYALCDTAICVPSQSDPTKVICSCFVEDGVSLGENNCSAWAPIGMYLDENGEWIIKAGYSVGQITSTYSFENAAPTAGNAVDPNNTSADYSGDIYLKPCMNGNWADCWTKPCSVLPEDITADVNTDRKASKYAACDCGLVVNSSEWYIGVYGNEQCENKTMCNDYIISGATTKSMDPGRAMLKKYLLEHPDADSSQQYAMGYCENCTNCT
ncbi:MAG: hypothetical protein V1862_09320, partial [Methanobacteriota archaeon]